MSFEKNDADQPTHLDSLNSAFSLAASILLKHGPISQITILSKQASLSLDQSHNSLSLLMTWNIFVKYDQGALRRNVGQTELVFIN